MEAFMSLPEMETILTEISSWFYCLADSLQFLHLGMTAIFLEISPQFLWKSRSLKRLKDSLHSYQLFLGANIQDNTYTEPFTTVGNDEVSVSDSDSLLTPNFLLTVKARRQEAL